MFRNSHINSGRISRKRSPHYSALRLGAGLATAPTAPAKGDLRRSLAKLRALPGQKHDMHIYTHIGIHICIYTYTRVHMCMFTCLATYIFMFRGTYLFICLFTYVLSHLYMYIYTCLFPTHLLTPLSTYTISINICIHTCIHRPTGLPSYDASICLSINQFSWQYRLAVVLFCASPTLWQSVQDLLNVSFFSLQLLSMMLGCVPASRMEPFRVTLLAWSGDCFCWTSRYPKRPGSVGAGPKQHGVLRP